MTQKIVSKFLGTCLASLLLSTCSIIIAEAQSTTSAKDQSTVSSAMISAQTSKETTTNQTQVNDSIFRTVKELTDQGIHLEQIQNELQLMMNNMPTDLQTRGQHSLSLRGFYGTSIFSCRGFA
jgi:hypothetical protein